MRGSPSQKLLLMLMGIIWVLNISPKEQSPSAPIAAPKTQVKHLVWLSHVLQRRAAIAPLGGARGDHIGVRIALPALLRGRIEHGVAFAS